MTVQPANYPTSTINSCLFVSIRGSKQRATRLGLLLTGLFIGAVTAIPAVAAPELKAQQADHQIEVYVGDALFTAYKYNRDQKYPYFWPVNGPVTGKSVTTESTEPYPHHHSLFFGCDKVNGGNYWQNTNAHGQILSQGPKIEKARGHSVIITDECHWAIPGQDPVMADHRRITVTAPSKTQRILDFEITLEPLVDITIEKTNHSLFSARMVPELSVEQGGSLVNAAGDSGESGTFGVASPWCDYSGTRDGVTEGLAIFQHPENRWYPSKWFTRDYGFFSPTPMYWPEDGVTHLPKGEDLTLRYRVVVHTGDVEAAGMGALFEAYVGK